jgi:hypothetical protein
VASTTLKGAGVAGEKYDLHFVMANIEHVTRPSGFFMLRHEHSYRSTQQHLPNKVTDLPLAPAAPKGSASLSTHVSEVRGRRSICGNMMSAPCPRPIDAL